MDPKKCDNCGQESLPRCCGGCMGTLEKEIEDKISELSLLRAKCRREENWEQRIRSENIDLTIKRAATEAKLAAAQEIINELTATALENRREIDAQKAEVSRVVANIGTDHCEACQKLHMDCLCPDGRLSEIVNGIDEHMKVVDAFEGLEPRLKGQVRGMLVNLRSLVTRLPRRD